MSTTYSFNTKIISIKEHFESRNWRMVMQEDKKVPVCDQYSIGWYILFEGSRESIYVGSAKPDLVEGQQVKVSIIPAVPMGA